MLLQIYDSLEKVVFLPKGIVGECITHNQLLTVTVKKLQGDVLHSTGDPELIIGAILHAEQNPSLFEIWTLVDGEPMMLARGGSRNRYVWYVVNEASGSAAK